MKGVIPCSVHGMIDTPLVREFKDQLGRGGWPTPTAAIKEILRRRTLPRKGIWSGPVIGYAQVPSRSYWMFSIFILKGHPEAKLKPRICKCADGSLQR